VAGKVSGLYVGVTAAGAVLVWSGWKGATLAATLKSLLAGNLNAAATEGVVDVSAAALGVTAANFNSIPGTENSSATVAASASQDQWNTALLAGLNAPATSANLESLAQWQAHEEPTSDWDHWNNPMNTTLTEPGSSSQNSVGVQEFTSLSQGLQATIDTLDSGAYSAIILALRSGQGLPDVGPPNSQASADLSTWSGGGYSSV
jgi:hypothetical protein